MGAEASSLKNLRIGKPFLSSAESSENVTVSPATNEKDGKKYTVFKYPKTLAPNDYKKHIEVLKTTRHPHILKYVATYTEPNRLNLITEQVTPLDVAIERQEKEDILVGLYNILEALVFLHDKSNICHNGISVSNVFVAANGDWKLSSFQNSSKVQRLSKQSYDNDIIGYGEFALSVLEYLRDDSSATSDFIEMLNQSFSEEGKENLGSLKSLLDEQIFDFPYMNVLLSLRTLPLMQPTQKQNFFRSLESNLHGSPPLSVCNKCIPLLFATTVLSDPSSKCFHKCLFSSGNEYCMRKSMMPLFDKEYFIKYCMPCIYDLFNQREATIRLILVKNIQLYVDCIDKIVLKEEVLPELLVGLQDNDDIMIAATLKALSFVVPILGGESVVGRHGMKLFFNRQPNFGKSPENGAVIDIKHTNYKSDDGRENKRTDREKRDKQIENRERQRVEREKQREEQRRKREERKKERENEKFKKIQKQSSTDEYSSEAIEVTHNDSFDSVKQVKDEDESSEADWEGFNANDHEPIESVKPLSNHWNDQTVSRHNSDQVGNDTFDNDDDDDDADWGDNWNDIDDTTENKKKSAEIKNIETVTTLIEKQVINENEENSIELTKQSNIETLKTLNKKNSSSKLELKSTKKVTPSKTRKKSLDEDFGMEINVASSEPDYFADMMPSFDDKSRAKTILIEKKDDLSSKFQAANEEIEEEASGWGDDDNGWGDGDDF